jgi:RHS repeat-associated protein
MPRWISGTSARGLLWSLMVTALVPPALLGQVDAPGGPLKVTTVTNIEPTRLPNSGPFSVPFTVQNVGTSTVFDLTLTCFQVSPVICGSVSPTSRLSLAAGASFSATVQYTTGATTGTGTVGLNVTDDVGDAAQGSRSVPVSGPISPTTVVLRNQNPDNIDRSACLTSGAGEAAAWQCGDLLVTHAMPAFTTLNKGRSLTLVYNSAQAVPKPLVAVAVTESTMVYLPNSIFAELKVNGVSKASATYSAWNTAPFVRQIALTYDASTDSSGIYPFTLEVQNRYSTATYSDTISGNLIVVNRSQSRYGKGWSLAGVEELRLNQPGGTILWVGGDGSAKVYNPIVPGSSWLAAPGGFQETLNLSGSVYTRTLRYGVQVQYDAQGRHTKTISRTGQTTTLTYDASGRLSTIVVPPGISGTTYTLAYVSTNGLLDKITDPGTRVLDATVNATSRVLSSLKDPDNVTTSFGYNTAGQMTSRTTRRGYTTKYTYANALRVTRVAVPTNPATNDSAITVFAPWDEKGLSGASPVDTAQAYTFIQGPRVNIADDATFWVNRWGAPTKVIDPLGHTTTYGRGNSIVPLLVTKVSFPDGRVDSMSYNARGNLTQLLEINVGSPNAITQYLYNDGTNAPDSPTSITDPENVVTGFAYNSMGLTSQVTAPNGHLTKFSYKTSGSLVGSLVAVTELKVPAWDSASHSKIIDSLHTGFAYNTFGNVVADTSPMNRVQKYTRDSKQRATDFYDTGGHHTQYVYDALDRVTSTIQHVEQAGNSGFPADSGYTGALTTTSHYNIDVLDQVTDPRGVIRTFQYDAANRQIGETDELGKTETRAFDQAGLLLSAILRTGDTVRYAYDAAGRKTKTAWGGRDNLPADSVLFTYDVMGRMLTAVTRDKRVARTYDGAGNLATDLQDGSAQVTVTQATGYDRAGKRVWHRIGPANSLLNADSLTYRYDPPTGDVTTIAVRWRKRFTTDPTVYDSVQFKWDSLGRRDTLTYSNGTKVRFAYDRDGHLRVLCGNHSGGPSDDPLNFTVAHQWMDQDGMIRSTTNLVSAGLTGCGASGFIATEQNTYWWRHSLRTQSQGSNSSSFVYDSSGNQTRRIDVTGGTPFTFTDSMPALSNRLVKHKSVNANTWSLLSFDNAGRRLTELPCSPSGCFINVTGNRSYFYDGLGRTAGTNETRCTVWDPNSGKCNNWGIVSSTLCGYDPLGRMTQLCDGSVLGYDGDEPIRTGADTDVGGWTFVQGPGTDDPLLAFSPFSGRYMFFVTDGAGRQYAVADRAGSNMLNDPDYLARVKFAGGTIRGSTFSAERFQQNTQPGLSFYRNRFYDQATGRWTQEDPVGVAGGVNLYQFNGSNPVMYSDPFGLCPPRDSSPCTLGDVATLNVSAGLQAGASLSVGLVGGYTKFQLGRVANFAVSTKYPTELTVSDKEASIEVGGELVGQRGGLKLDLAQDSPQIVGTGSLGSNDVGHESTQRDGRNRSTKIGVQVGLGAEININWAAIADLGQQAYEKLKGAIGGGSQ